MRQSGAARSGIRTRALAVLAFACLANAPASAQTVELEGPPGSGRFGQGVTVLANGRIVITDPSYDSGGLTDVGAVYLYDPVSGVLRGPLVGSKAYDNVGRGGVTALANGNYVVRSPSWDSTTATNAGAVTWCSGSTGCTGPVSAANSLIGTATSAAVGRVTALSNGHYVVVSPNWDNGDATNAGAVVWCNGTRGCSGRISAANSLTSTRSFTSIGGGGVFELADGSYVVHSPSYDEIHAIEIGATTWCPATRSCTGLVSGANSLIGSTRDDGLRSGVVPLDGGAYVVHSPDWDDGDLEDVGAATWCAGGGGCTGFIGGANSLHGTVPGSRVGSDVVALPGGRYVVVSPRWDDGGGGNGIGKGATTFCGVATGCAGPVTAANSLVGERGSPAVLERTRAGSGGVTALANGDYVVSSPEWDNGPVAGPAARLDAGAVTRCSGATGCIGVVSAANSLVGSARDDRVGAVTALASGGYVVSSPRWDGAAADVGAVSFCGGPAGCVGVVSAANSLVGSSAGDGVGRVAPLAGGGYAVAVPGWNNGSLADAGAVATCSGAVGCLGALSPANALVGSAAGDAVGAVTALAGGGFVVASSGWNAGAAANAGAVTWCSAAGSCTGPVSPANSLVGSSAGDGVGEARALEDGNYVVVSPAWDAGEVEDVGAVTFGDGAAGTLGPVSAANSVLGSDENTGPGLNAAYDAANARLVIGRPGGNLVTLVPVPEPGAGAGAAAVLAALGWLRRRPGAAPQPIRALCPPSTASATPVTKRASSEARKSAA